MDVGPLDRWIDWIGDAPRPPGSLVVNTMPCSELMVGEGSTWDMMTQPMLT